MLYDLVLFKFLINPLPGLRDSHINGGKFSLDNYKKNYMIEAGLEICVFVDEPVQKSVHGLVGCVMCDAVTHLPGYLTERLLG